jgi:hypothetical protein
MESDPAQDKADHTLSISAATIYPIFQSSSESNMRTEVKSTWWAKEIYPLQRPLKKSSESQKRRWNGLPVWLGNSIKGRGIRTYRTTQGRRKMNPRMGLHQGDTTQSSTHSVVLTESDSETSYD